MSLMKIRNKKKKLLTARVEQAKQPSFKVFCVIMGRVPVITNLSNLLYKN